MLRFLCLLFFFLFLFSFDRSFSAFAAEKQIGTACKKDASSADWDALAQCDGSVFIKAPLALGKVSAPPYVDTACDSSKAGMIQWTGSLFQGCNGTDWVPFGSTSSFSFIEFKTPLTLAFSSTGAVVSQIVPLPGVPSGARYILADVFSSVSANDQVVTAFGRGPLTNQKQWVDATGKGGNPAIEFGDLRRHAVYIVNHGEWDNYTDFYGEWHSSLIIPINADSTVSMNNNSNSGSSSHFYFVIRAYAP